MNHSHTHEDAPDTSPAEHWESQYAESERRWSGRVNPTMADVVGGLGTGDVLELGCGEGGDALWLAQQGWRVVAVDISPTAVRRGAEEAARQGVAERIVWVAADLATWATDSTFDLITATFFHSTTDLPRTEILKRAAGRVRPGGHLLLVSHVFETPEDVPPWARRHQEESGEGGPPLVDLTPEDEVAELALESDSWDVVRTEIRLREATGPDGVETATLKDGVTLLRRK